MTPAMHIKLVRHLRALFPHKHVNISVDCDIFTSGTGEIEFKIYVEGVICKNFVDFISMLEFIKDLTKRSEIVVGDFNTVIELLERGGL